MTAPKHKIDPNFSLQRREFLAAGSALSTGLVASTLSARSRARFKAIAFDALAVFDPRPIAALAEMLFPGKGVKLDAAWHMRQFEYTWLRTLSNRYTDFMRVTEDALIFAANATRLDLPRSERDQLLHAYTTLKTWPDVVPALKALKESGYDLAILSNFTPDMLSGCIKSSGAEDLFDHALSTDIARAYKPDPRAYQLGVDALRRRREDVLFVAFAGWDAAGARAFGYPTFWLNRLHSPPEELGDRPDGTGADLTNLLAFLES